MRRREPMVPLAAFALIIGSAISVVQLPSLVSGSPLPLEEWVPMRDGVVLHTLIFLPDPGVWGSGPYPTIMSRTPYGIGSKTHPISCPPGCSRTWQEAVEKGYAVVHQDTRGRFLSQGVDRIFDDTGPDGYDTIEWVADQSWCDGNIGLTGISAGGIVTYLTAAEKPPHLTAIMPFVGTASIVNDYVFRGGSAELNIVLPWIAFQSFNLSASHLEYLMSLGLTQEDIRALHDQLSLIWTEISAHASFDYPHRSVDSHWWMYLPIKDYPAISQLLPTFSAYMENLENASWRDSFDTVDDIEVPGLHISGWFDLYPDSNLRAFSILQERVGNQKIFIYNGVHEESGERLPYDPYFRWWDYWLKGIDNGIMDEPSVLYQTWGAGDWRLSDTWPPSDVEYATYYLHSDGSLTTNLPLNNENPIAYVYDPHDPVPTRGGRMGGHLHNNPAGSFDQRPVEPPYRDDVLVYTSDVLREDVEVTGPVYAYVSASSNCSDTDFIVKLIDVHPDGSTMLILDGVTRAKWHLDDLMKNGATYQIPIDLEDISVIFRAGHRIQVDVTSSNFPARDRNTNTGNPFGTDSKEDILFANNTIYHDADNPSYIVLPIGHGAVGELTPLRVTAQLSPNTATQGDTVTILASVKDDSGEPVVGAEVTATTTIRATGPKVIVPLADQGNGNYERPLDTSVLPEGTYTFTVVAEKVGYEPTETSAILTVGVGEAEDDDQPWILFGGIAAIAIAIAAILLYRVRRRSYDRPPPGINTQRSRGATERLLFDRSISKRARFSYIFPRFTLSISQLQLLSIV